MPHPHEHDHCAGHHHGTLNYQGNNQGRTFVFTILLNLVFVLIEFAYGFIANSTAVMADAGHKSSDGLGLLLAWSAVILARKQSSQRYTYGLRSTSILAALAYATLLLVACGAIALEASQRFSQPPR
jgi:cobalt-zinc-cadmium efflux system protein